MAREFKDSGIEWIGQIPKEWKMARGKYLFSVLNGYAFDSSLFTNDTNMMPLIRIRDINNSETEAYYMGDYSSDYIVQKGEVLVGMDGDFNVAKWKGSDALLNQRVCKLNVFSEKYISLYAYYILPMLLKTKNDVTYATTVKHLSSNDILNFDFIVPTITEQQKIADYLDKVCGEIDEMVALQETMIEELKAYKQSVITEAVTKGLNPNAPMRNSGIDWIGEIPKHWSTTKIKKIARTNSGSTPRNISDGENSNIVWIRTTDINDDVVYDSSLHLTSEEYSSASCPMLDEGTCVVAMYGGGGTIGKSGMLGVKATINQALCSMEVGDSFTGEYLFCILRSVRYYWMKYAVGTRKDPNINQEIVRNMIIPFPPIDEQRAIATYLDTKCSEIDSLIALKQAKIEELKEYKKSVIYEYVTGKKEVV